MRNLQLKMFEVNVRECDDGFIKVRFVMHYTLLLCFMCFSCFLITLLLFVFATTTQNCDKHCRNEILVLRVICTVRVVVSGVNRCCVMLT